MKYVVLLIAVFAIGGILIFGELTFESPETRLQQQQIARQTLSIIGTQTSTIGAQLATVDALMPMETQKVALEHERDALLATQDAFLLGTVVVPTATPRPTIIPTQAPVVRSTATTTVAAGVDDNGCAINPTTDFEISGASDSTSVYLVNRARNVQPGQQFQTRWYPNDNPSTRYDSVTWTADANYAETCVYFWIDSTDIAFSYGFWTVELVVNGTTTESQTFQFCEPGWCQ